MRQIQILLLVFIMLLNSSCSNIFLGVANKNTDEALYESALKSVDGFDYDSAIGSINSMSPEYRAQPRVLRTLAGAYAGKCGLDFASYVASFSTSSSSFLKFLMNAWTTKTTSRAHCRLAEDTMKLIAPTYLTRAPGDAFFMFFLGAVKAGVYLRELVDTDRDGAAQNPPFDGTAGGSFCLNTNLSDDLVVEIGSGISMMVANFLALGSSISGVTVDLSTITTGCSAVTPNPCLIEDEATLLADANAVKAFRTLLNMNALDPAGLPCP